MANKGAVRNARKVFAEKFQFTMFRSKVLLTKTGTLILLHLRYKQQTEETKWDFITSPNNARKAQWPAMEWSTLIPVIRLDYTVAVLSSIIHSSAFTFPGDSSTEFRCRNHRVPKLDFLKEHGTLK